MVEFVRMCMCICIEPMPITQFSVWITYTNDTANFPGKLSLDLTKKEPLPPWKSCRITRASLRDNDP